MSNRAGTPRYRHKGMSEQRTEANRNALPENALAYRSARTEEPAHETPAARYILLE
jgi:hypothetical protein